jgi:hypothetical protein
LLALLFICRQFVYRNNNLPTADVNLKPNDTPVMLENEIHPSCHAIIPDNQGVKYVRLRLQLHISRETKGFSIIFSGKVIFYSIS